MKIPMSRRETLGGWLYLAAELLILPRLAGAVSSLFPLSAAQINFCFFLLNFLATVAVFRRFLLKNLTLAGESIPLTALTVLRALAAYFAAQLLLPLLPGLAVPNVNDAAITAMAGEDYRLVAVGTVFLVPTAEELLHRGLIFGALRPKSRWAAYLASTAFFGAIHVLGYLGRCPLGVLALCFLQYAPAGLCLAWAYDKTGCILAPILVHTLINAVGIYAVR